MNQIDKIILAHNLVTKAKYHKELTPPNKCSNCLESKKVVAHHEDYNKPLDITWLCHLCHKRRHRELKAL